MRINDAGAAAAHVRLKIKEQLRRDRGAEQPRLRGAMIHINAARGRAAVKCVFRDSVNGTPGERFSMAVEAGDVLPGAFFMALEQELRKVHRVVTDAAGRTRISYQCKPATVPNRALLFGHALANPPTLEEFLARCLYRLSEPELRVLREQGILLEHE